MKVVESIVNAMNPMVLGGAVAAVVVIVLLLVVMGKKKGAAQTPIPPPRPGAGGNIASKENLEKIQAGPASPPPPKKPLSSQTANTKMSGPAAGSAKGGKPAFEDVAPDPKLVTQYQEGTGEGIEALEERLKEDPNNSELLDWLAFMYYTQKQFEKAIQAYDKLINLGNNSEHQHYYLGNSFYQIGKYDRAVEHWEMVEAMGGDSKLAQSAKERRTKLQDMLSKGAL